MRKGRRSRSGAALAVVERAGEIIREVLIGSRMKVIILAGGMGTRLRGVIDDVPKPMAPVGGRPFLEYLLLQLKKWGRKDVVLSVGYKKEIIRVYFGDGSQLGISISYSEEDQPLGTGGGLKKAISSNAGSHFIVMNGDSFFDIAVPDLVEYHKSRQSIVTMSLASLKERGRYGGVEIDAQGRVLSFRKEGLDTPGLINGGIYVISREVANYIPEGAISLESNILPLLQKEHLLYGKEFDAFFLDMGLPKDYHWIDKHPERLL